MLITLNICYPFLSKLLELPKLFFCFNDGDVFFTSLTSLPFEICFLTHVQCKWKWMHYILGVLVCTNLELLKCIFSPYPWFTKKIHNRVVSFELGSILFNDTSFCFQRPSKSCSIINRRSSLKWFCIVSQDVVNFFSFPITRSCNTLKNKQHGWCSSSTTKSLPFFVFTQGC
jgi:hypothetical protein